MIGRWEIDGTDLVVVVPEMGVVELEVTTRDGRHIRNGYDVEAAADLVVALAEAVEKAGL